MPVQAAVKLPFAVAPALVSQSVQVALLKRCKFRPRLSAGMTRGEAAEAIEAALTSYIACIKTPLTRTQ